VSVGYVPVQWNRHKKVYDAILVAFVVAYLVVFVAVGKWAFRGADAISDEILLMRALGSCAFFMLTVVLCIGPLARLDRRFLPILYNRRHLGVATFVVALAHGALAIGFYHGFGNVNPFVSLLTSNTNFVSLRAFPFQILGLLALTILLFMAATSHDFWLKNLGQNFWKRLHMLVYFAYVLVIMHVVLGALQSQRSLWLAAAVGASVVLVSALHRFGGRRELRRDRQGLEASASATGLWMDIGTIDEFPDHRGKAVCLAGGERIAVFRYNGSVSALTNVCAHQGGPLGEGRIIDGCVTCPWHGWQYQPADGQSPPPFTEKIPTYRVRIVNRRILLDPNPCAPGTFVEPARCEETTVV
jgi:DMSO/TMAO reductase YedYZ heme-binding membrane subunit/nitrite reductase/ring-hydroxylating ferredoxin subunit